MKQFISITLLLLCCCGMKGQQTVGYCRPMDAQSEMIGGCVKKRWNGEWHQCNKPFPYV